MERGYALAVDAQGVVLKSASGVSAGDKVSVMFSDGTIKAEVYGTEI
jgi:exonuclease VII large subunit